MNGFHITTKQTNTNTSTSTLFRSLTFLSLHFDPNWPANPHCGKQPQLERSWKENLLEIRSCWKTTIWLWNNCRKRNILIRDLSRTTYGLEPPVELNRCAGKTTFKCILKILADIADVHDLNLFNQRGQPSHLCEVQCSHQARMPLGPYIPCETPGYFLSLYFSCVTQTKHLCITMLFIQ